MILAQFNKRWHSPVNVYMHLNRLKEKIGSQSLESNPNWKRAREARIAAVMAFVITQIRENIIKKDIKYFLLNSNNIKKFIMKKNNKRLNNDFKAIEFENKKEKVNRDIDRLLELYLNDDIPESIRKSSIADKLREKKEELNIINSAIYSLNNIEKIEKLREKRINSLKRLLSNIKLGMLKFDGIDWKRLITFFIDKIEINCLGKINKTTKLDLYLHYNFNSLAIENIGKIIYPALGEWRRRSAWRRPYKSRGYSTSFNRCRR